MSLLLNMLSRLVITFPPRSKRLLISWLLSPSAVILEPPKNKVWHCFHCFPIYFPWSDRTGCHDLTVIRNVLEVLCLGSWIFFFLLNLYWKCHYLSCNFPEAHIANVICHYMEQFSRKERRSCGGELFSLTNDEFPQNLLRWGAHKSKAETTWVQGDYLGVISRK